MKYILLLAFGLMIQLKGFAQDIFTAKGVSVTFFSSSPLEDIEGKTNKAVSAINTSTRAIYFKVPVNTFEFEERLMQQHFNATYMETEKYPWSEFKGQIVDAVDLSKDGVYNVTVEGTLNLHGVDKTYREHGTITVQGGAMKLNAKFNVKLADHKVKIPSIVVKNIAEQVAVTVNAAYTAAAK